MVFHHRRLTVSTVTITALLFAACGAWAVEPACPASIAVEESLKQRYEGWIEGRANEPRRLSRITIFEGPPEELASLIGQQHNVSKATMVSTWRLTPGGRYFMSCSYSGTRIVLSQPIPSNYREVTITYSRNVSIDGAPEIQKVEWK